MNFKLIFWYCSRLLCFLHFAAAYFQKLLSQIDYLVLKWIWHEKALAPAAQGLIAIKLTLEWRNIEPSRPLFLWDPGFAKLIRRSLWRYPTTKLYVLEQRSNEARTIETSYSQIPSVLSYLMLK